MKALRIAAGILGLSLFCAQGHAQNLPLQNLDAGAMNEVVGDMSANFLHTSVSGASTLGHIWGFEVGLVGGQTQTPHLNDVVNSAPNTDANAGHLPNGEILGVL